MKRLFLLTGLLTSLLLLTQGIHYLRDGFSPRRLQSFYRFLGDPSKLELTAEIEEILSQPFFYLGRGRQCFAFQSKDQKYVLKFPRTDIHKIPLWIQMLPNCAIKTKVKETHLKRREAMLDSFALAHEELSQETGTLLVHFGDILSTKKLHLVDAIGISHSLPLGSTFFALQKKQPCWTTTFLQQLKENHRDKAKQTLQALVHVIDARAKKGIVNRDRSFLRNYGFDGERAFQIDIGSFYRPTQMSGQRIFETSICDSFDPIEHWLSQLDEEMTQYFLTLKKELFQSDGV